MIIAGWQSCHQSHKKKTRKPLPAVARILPRPGTVVRRPAAQAIARGATQCSVRKREISHGRRIRTLSGSHFFVESDAPAIRDVAQEVIGSATDEVERACRLFSAVRDGIRYDAYNIVVTPRDVAGDSRAPAGAVVVRAQKRVVGGRVPRRGHSLPVVLCQRLQPHGHQETAGFPGYERLLLPRL